MNNKFVRNFNSNTATKALDLSADLPLSPMAIILSEEIPAGVWGERGFELVLNDLSCQLKISILASFDKYTPRTYKPVYSPELNSLIEFTIASTATDPGLLNFCDEFRGDFIRFQIENTGSNPISDLSIKALLSQSPELS